MKTTITMLASLALAGSAFGQNLSNGSFEANGFTVPAPYRYVNSEAVLTDWTVINDGVGEESYWTHNSGYGGITEGSYAFNINYGDTLSQTVNGFTSGNSYDLTFSTNGTVDVTIFGNTYTASSGPQLINFTASSASSLFTVGNAQSVVALDNFNIVPVPETSTTLLGAIGVLGMALRRRRA